MVPTDANFMGNVFGGAILADIDRVAYVTATRHARRSCVTASFDRVDFLRPVHVGQVVEYDARLTFVGRTSMEVAIEARAESLTGDPPAPVVNAWVTMVAVDAEGRPTAVPELRLTTPEERNEFGRGRDRMAARRAGRPVRSVALPSRSPRAPAGGRPAPRRSNNVVRNVR
jgi:acyl-CoA hydrolase